MARAAAAGGGEGRGILLIQRRRAAMSPGPRHCSLPPGPGRSGSRLARSLHLLPLAVLQRVRNDAVSGPLPSLRAGRGTSRGRGGGWSQRGAGGGRRLRRLHPEAPPAGCAGGRAGRRPRRRRRDARGGGPRPTAPAVPSRAWPWWTSKTPTGLGRGLEVRALSLSGDPSSANCLESAPFPKKSKQQLTRSGPAHPSRRRGSQRSSPASRTQTLCFQSLPGAPQGSPFRPSSSFPIPLCPSFPSLAGFTSHPTNNVIPTSRKSSLQIACSRPSFLCPAYHKITIYSEKGLYNECMHPGSFWMPLFVTPVVLDSSVKENCMKFPIYKINNTLQ